MEPVRNAYIRFKSSHVLMADWSDVAALRYFIARDMIAPVGKKICHLLTFFAKHTNITADKIHIIGHSLGAHVSTHVGRCFKGEIGRYSEKRMKWKYKKYSAICEIYSIRCQMERNNLFIFS
jgi:hypothetical protein